MRWQRPLTVGLMIGLLSFGIGWGKSQQRKQPTQQRPALQHISIASFDNAPVRLHGTLSTLLTPLQRRGIMQLASLQRRISLWYDPLQRVPYWIAGTQIVPFQFSLTSPAEYAVAFYRSLQFLAPVLGIRQPEKEFRIFRYWRDALGMTHIRAEQHYQGIPVWGSELILHFDAGGRAYALSARIHPAPSAKLDVQPSISRSEVPKLLEQLAGNQSLMVDTVRLQWFPDREDPEKWHLVWHATAYAGWDRWEYFVSAHTGKLVFAYRNTHFDGPATAQAQDLLGQTRTIHTYQLGGTYYLLDASRPMFDPQRSQLPNNPVGAILTLNANNTDLETIYHIVSPNNTWSDPAAVSAHYNAGVTYTYYYTTHQRNSIDGNGGTMLSVIHVTHNGQSMANAFWNGKVMAYGDGGQIFHPLARGLDVAAHEMTHGVIEHTANLIYLSQSGAINESMADVFGVMVDRDDWLVGEDVVKPQYFPSGAMRNFADPHNGGSGPQDPYWQPAKMSEYVTLPETPEGDNGGVHINSGIPNHACYLIATAIGREKTEKIYYRALTTYLTRSSKFVDLRRAVIQAAIDLYGNGQEAQAARQAFDAVEIFDSGGGGGGPKDLPPVQGKDWILAYAPDLEALVLTDLQNQQYVVSQSGLIGRPTLTDDGTIALFVAGDQTLHAVSLDPNNLQEAILSSDPVWGSVAISADGRRLAMTSIYAEPYIYIADLTQDPAPVKQFQIYTPDYAGAQPSTALYPDAIQWSYDGRFVLFDMLNAMVTEWGDTVEYWDIGILDAWNPAQQTFGSGIVQRALPPFPETISVGNPSYASNSPYIITFELVDVVNQSFYIAAANLETQQVNLLVQNVPVLGFPDYSSDDRAIGFTTLDINDDYVFAVVPVGADKITPAGNVQGVLGGASVSVMFRQGSRPATSVRSGAVDVLPAAIEILYAHQHGRQLQIGVHLSTPGDATIVIADLLGRTVAKQHIPAGISGVQTVAIPLPHTLSTGAYLVSVVTANGTQSRLVKIGP